MLNGSGSSIETARPLVERLAARFEVLVHDQRALGRTTVPERLATMADYAADAAALLDHLGWATGARVRDQLRRDGRPGARRHRIRRGSSGWHSCAPRPAGSAARRTRCTSWRGSTRWSGRRLSLRRPRQPLRRGVAGRPSTRPRHRRQRLAGAGSPTPAHRRAGAAARRADRGAAHARRLGPAATRSPARRSWPAASSTASPRLRTARPSPQRIAGSELRRYQGGHFFVVQDPSAPGHPRVPRLASTRSGSTRRRAGGKSDDRSRTSRGHRDRRRGGGAAVVGHGAAAGGPGQRRGDHRVRQVQADPASRPQRRAAVRGEGVPADQRAEPGRGAPVPGDHAGPGERLLHRDDGLQRPQRERGHDQERSRSSSSARRTSSRRWCAAWRAALVASWRR